MQGVSLLCLLAKTTVCSKRSVLAGFYAGRACTFAERPSLFNVTRQYKMRVKQNIPSVLRIGSSNPWVSYVGQKRTCSQCGATGHIASACDIIKCYKCLGLGHAADECPNRGHKTWMWSKKRRHKRYSLQKCFNYVVSKINAGSADTDLLLQHKSIKKELEGF